MGTAKRERQKAGRQARIDEARREQKKAETRRRFTTAAIFAAVFLGLFLVLAFLRRNDNQPTEQSTSGTTLPTSTSGTLIPVGATITGPTPCPPADGSAERTTTFAQAPPTCIDPAKSYAAKVSTTKGDFTIALDAKSAPQTVNNFVVLSRYHFYDGVPFHRVVKDFVIQTGDPVGVANGKPGQGGPGYTITDENPPDTSVYTKGSVAMANTGQPNSGGSQWFVLTGTTPLPTATYPRFGQVTEGLDTTVAAIAATAPPNDPSGTGQPTDPTTITTITITES